MLREEGLLFANPDQVMPDKAVEPPYFGSSHARVTRRLLESPQAYVPPTTEATPTGLEEWSITFWPVTSDTQLRRN